MKNVKNRLGRCYELSARYLLEGGQGRLVHGSGMNPTTGMRIDHAWIRDDSTGTCFDPVANERRAIAEFVQLYDVVEERSYTSQESAKMLVEHNHYGPWHK